MADCKTTTHVYAFSPPTTTTPPPDSNELMQMRQYHLDAVGRIECVLVRLGMIEFTTSDARQWMRRKMRQAARIDNALSHT